jgi:hypothetical protein
VCIQEEVVRIPCDADLVQSRQPCGDMAWTVPGRIQDCHCRGGEEAENLIAKSQPKDSEVHDWRCCACLQELVLSGGVNDCAVGGRGSEKEKTS